MNIKNFVGAFIAGTVVLLFEHALAQTTTTAAGTVSEFGPDAITIRSESASPTRYGYSKATTYVDEDGNPVSVETVRSGAPVTVYYEEDGNRRIARRVVVRRHVAASAPVIERRTEAVPTRAEERTVSTDAAGTISEFNPDGMAIRTDAGSAPVHYKATRTTTYVDDAGNPVSVETVRSGLPVHVYYSREGDTLVADKVVVTRRAAVPAEPGTIIERRTTTTTTTTPGRISNERR